MRNTSTFLITILLISFFSSCSNSSNNNNETDSNLLLETPKVESLINYLIEHPDTENKNDLYKSLDSLISLDSNLKLLDNGIQINQNSSVNLNFVNSYEVDYYIKGQNAYILTLSDSGLIHKNNPTNFSKYSNEIKKEYYELIYSDSTPQKKIGIVKFFGSVTISKQGIIIDIQDNTESIDWNQYVNTINQVFAVYKSLWNEKSIEHWNTKFENLNTEKKKVILEMYPLGIELNFRKRTFF